MTDDRTTVAIIDSDTSLRARLKILIGAAGLTTKLFKSAEEFEQIHISSTQLHRPGRPATWNERARSSVQAGQHRTQNIPGFSYRSERREDVCSSDEGRRCGLSYQPLEDQALLDAVICGIERDRAARLQEGTLDLLRGRLASLSSRERETMMLLSSGNRPKQIAAHLGICTHTGRVRSSRILAKIDR